MKADRFLIGILSAIGLLVIIAVVLFFIRGTPEYRTDESPETAVYNYVLAIQKEDYQRAYDSLADAPEKPDFAAFRLFFSDRRGQALDVGLQILSTDQVDDEAFVTVEMIYDRSGVFNNGWREEGTARLAQQDNVWKLRQMPYQFWAYEWYTETGQ